MNLRSKRNLRAVSAFVLTSFVGSLSTPVFAAGAAAPSASPTADAMGAVSTRALSDMWGVWNRHLSAYQGPKSALSAGYAANFFKGQGASPAQVDVLVNNARSNGMLTSGTPTLTQATKSVGDKLKGLFRKVGTPKAEAVKAAEAKPTSAKAPASSAPAGDAAAAAAKPGLTSRVRSLFSRFKPASSAKAAAAKPATTAKPAASAIPVPGANAYQGVGLTPPRATTVTPAPKAPGDQGLLASAASKVRGAFQATGNAVKGAAAKTTKFVKGVADKTALGARRGAYAVGSTAQTGYLTTKYAIDPRPYFEIPIKGQTSIKVRGTHKSTVAFKDGKFTVKDFHYKSTWPTKADLAARVDAGAAQAQPKGFFGKVVAKFKGLSNNVKTRMRGEAKITPETRMEIQRLEISNNMIDQARTISDAQRALRVRIDQMKHTSQSLRRPLDVEQVKAMEKQIRSLEGTKKDLLKKASGTMDSKSSAVVKDAAKWALYSVGITASVNLIRQAFTDEGVDVGKAFSFLAQPSFWGGTAGGFLGSTLATALATSFMPPGVGLFMKVLPGFLGAAFGFDVGSSLFGGEMDLLGTMVTTLASAGGYTLAASLMGGVAAAPAFALIGAAIASGSLAGFLLDKFRGGPESESYILPEGPLDEGLDLGAPVASADPGSQALVTADASGGTDLKASITSANLATAQRQVDQAYNSYITYLKARKIPEATEAHKAYMDAMKQLEIAKGAAGQ